jgi:ribonuclease HI
VRFSDEADLLRLERALAERYGAAVEGGLAHLLTDDFIEFGASGRIWDRAATVELLEGEPGTAVELLEPAFRWLSPDVVLLTYRLAGARPSLRSSVWIRTDGRWRVAFHQGTRTA